MRKDTGRICIAARLRWFVALVLLGLASTSPAAIVPRLSLDRLVSESEFIVHGRVLDFWSSWDRGHTFIWTHYRVAVDDQLKGQRSAIIVVSEPGGTLEGEMVQVSGAVDYSPGEEVVLFLYRTPIGFLRALGHGQGKYSITEHANLRGLLPLDKEGSSFSARQSRLKTSEGTPLRRIDFQNIEFLVDFSVAPGKLNADGQPIITGDSDPITALRAAVATWSGVDSSAVRFAPVGTADAANTLGDGRHVFLFQDTPEIRSAVGSALAVTSIRSWADGRITDTDILFNPNIVSDGRRLAFSTTLAPNTYDLQSVATHELGHALGASHSGILGAAMYQATRTSRNVQAMLSSDDIAFLRAVYPAPGSEGSFGAIAGTVTFRTGDPVRAASIVAVDPTTGVHVAALSGLTDGAYVIPAIPPGSYFVYAEPLDGPVLPANVYLQESSVDTSFRTDFFGGVASPAVVQVTAGGRSTADITVEQGVFPLSIDILGAGSAEGIITYSSGPAVLQAGQPVDIFLWGPGLDATITRDNVRLLGPGLTIRPGTVRIDPRFDVDGLLPLRMTVDVAPRSTRALASIVLTRGSDMAAYSGSLIIVPAATTPVFAAANAASLEVGRAAPESWVSLFGENLAAGLMVAGTPSLPTSLGGTTVTVVDSLGAQRDAQLQFVAPTQINFLTSGETAPGTASVRVTTQNGGTASAGFTIEPFAPGLFTANSSGQGAAAALALRVAGDGARTLEFVFDTTAPLGSRKTVPIGLGPETDQVFLSLFGTGIRGANFLPTAQVGGVDVPVLSAGPQGESAGLDQVNIGPLPRTLAGRGEVDVVLSFGDSKANTVKVNIR